MTEFNPQTATTDELWDYCLVQYNSKNPVAKWILANYFTRIRQIVALLCENDRLLEVGCGAGASSRQILEMLHGQEFQVSEIDERYIKKLKETDFPLQVQQESVLNLRRKDKEFDCVFLLEVLEHVWDYKRALSEIFRVSRKYTVISVPNEPLWRMLNITRGKYLQHYGNTPTHVNHWSPESFKPLISRYGTVLKVFTPIPWIIVLAEAKATPTGSNIGK